MPGSGVGFALWGSRGDTRGAMSQGRVEAMRAAMAAFNRRDGEAFGAVFAEDAEIVPVRAAVDGTVYRGPDAGAQYCAAVEEIWENLRWEIEELREGGDWVLALGHMRGQGRHSGVDIDARAGWVARFRKGQVTNFHTYADRADALDAVGLSE
jgi:ketosteroid isomerase-like protein